VSLAPRSKVATHELALATVPVWAKQESQAVATVAVHADGDAHRATLRRVVELGSSATKRLVGEHGEGSTVQVLGLFNITRIKITAGVNHLRIMVILAVLSLTS
jgi:hypothetical protein